MTTKLIFRQSYSDLKPSQAPWDRHFTCPYPSVVHKAVYINGSQMSASRTVGTLGSSGLKQLIKVIIISEPV